MRLLRAPLLAVLLAALLGGPAHAEPDTLQGWLDVALQAIGEGRGADALAACDRALALDPASAEALNRRAFVLLRLGRPAEAEADATRALERSPGFGKPLYVRGLARYAMQQYAPAALDLLQAHQDAPELAHADSLEALAYSLYRTERCAESLPWWDRAIAADPQDAHNPLNRGTCRQQTGDAAGAIADFDAALRLKPDLSLARRHRGVLLMDAGRYAEAVSDLNEATRSEPGDAYAWGQLITANEALDQLPAAAAAAERYIALLPQVAWGWNSRGLLRLADGALDAAIADFTEAIRLDPAEPIYFNNRGEAHRRAGRWEAALADDDRCRALLPAGSRPHFDYRAEALTRLGRSPAPTRTPSTGPSTAPTSPSAASAAVSRWDLLRVMEDAAALTRDGRRTVLEQSEVVDYTRVAGAHLKPGESLSIMVLAPMNADVTIRFDDERVCPYAERPAGSLIEIRACYQANQSPIEEWMSYTIERGIAADPVLFVLMK